MVTRWIFNDTAVSETYTFEMNPVAGGSPTFKKNIISRSTSAPNGKTLLFEGLDEPQTLEFEGTLLYESQYNAFVAWFEKRRQIQLTDDLGRSYWVYIEEFNPKRERSALHPWKHSYTIKTTILDWA